MTKDQLRKIESEYRAIFESYGDSLLKEHINKIIEYDAILPRDSTFFCLTNTQNVSFGYVSKNIRACLGVDPNVLHNGGMKLLWSWIHPDDLDKWLEALNELMAFTLAEVSENDRKRMSYSWNYRLKNAQNEYVNVIQNTTPLEFDIDGKPIIGMAHYTVCGPELKMPITATAKFLNGQNTYETLYYNNFSQKLLSDGITNRERDIIRLLVQNFSTKQIAADLYISNTTVDTHRRNILKKLKLASTGELIGILKSTKEVI